MDDGTKSGGSESIDLGVWDSPLAIDEDSSETFGFDSKQSKMRYERAHQRCSHQFIGPIPVEEFLETFMDLKCVLKRWPWMPPPEGAFENVPERPESERDIYMPLIKSLNSYVDPTSGVDQDRCPDFWFLNTAERGDTTHGNVGHQKPDVCCYAKPHVDLIQLSLSEDEKVQNYGPTVMGYAALFIEVKKDPIIDPFKDIPAHQNPSRWKFVLNLQGVPPIKHEDVTQCLGQNITYAAEIMARQHRQFLFSILLCGTVARFIRWDRAGALVTTAFDIHRSPEHLCHFIWCFARVSDMRRGYDINVEMALPHEHAFFASVIRQHLASQLVIGSTEEEIEQALNVHFLENHVTAIQFPQSNSKEVKRLLVSRPFVYPLAVFGMGTRAYWAVDATVPLNSAHQVVLLKDTWREDPPSSAWTESGVLQQLSCVRAKRGVPSVLFYGDVIQRDEIVMEMSDHNFHIAIQDLESYQSTQTQELLNASWICGAAREDHLFRVRLRKRTHHRLVLDTPGQTLVQFRGSRELLTATYDVLETLNSASTECHIVHRTISPRSIILYRQPTTAPFSRRRAYLIDWDQSWDERRDLNHDNPFVPPWQFVCADLAIGAQPLERYQMVHDIESLLYVVLYLAIFWLNPTSKGGRDTVISNALKMFDTKSVDGGRPSSEAKQANKATKGKRFTNDLLWDEIPAMQTWMDTVFGALLSSTWMYEEVRRAWKKIINNFGNVSDRTFDRAQSLPPLDGLTYIAPRALTVEPNCPTMSSAGSLKKKRNLAELYGGADPVGSSFVKHLKMDLTLKTEGTVHGTSKGDPSPESAAFRGRNRQTSARRHGSGATTNAEAGPSRLAESRISVGPPAASSEARRTHPTVRVNRHGGQENPLNLKGMNARLSEPTSPSIPPPVKAEDIDYLFGGP